MRIALQAEIADATMDVRLHGHPLATARAGLDHAGEFVGGDHRTAQTCGANAPFGVPVQVRSTQPHGLDAQQGLTRARNRQRLLVQAQVVGSVQADGLHTRLAHT